MQNRVYASGSLTLTDSRISVTKERRAATSDGAMVNFCGFDSTMRDYVLRAKDLEVVSLKIRQGWIPIRGSHSDVQSPEIQFLLLVPLPG